MGTTTAERYLLALGRLAAEDGEPVPTGRIAAAVDRSPSATTEALQRLEARDLLVHEPYAGVSLTARGRAEATALARRVDVLSRFFGDVLDVDDPEHEAVQVAGVVSDEVTARLDATLLPPSTDDGAAPAVDD